MVSVYFLDSSALVKRYVTEPGSAWVRTLTDPKRRNSLIVTRLAWVEILSAFMRRQREGSFASSDANYAIKNLRYDLDHQYQIVEINRTLIEQSGDLVKKHPLRAYDAVQLASALHILPAFASAQDITLVFVSADERLIAAAQIEGLPVENPNLHPQ